MNNLTTYYQNVWGINIKLINIFHQNYALIYKNYDIIAVSKTWLLNSVNDAELGLYEQYTIFRCD